jgi:putative flippase GtrA
VWVFPASPGSSAGGFVVFTILNLGGLGITWAAMGLFVHLARLNYALAKIVSLGLAFSWSFTSRKYWIFAPIRVSALPASE